MMPFDLMNEDMVNLAFVNWDRYVEGNVNGADSVDVYGWIEREDDHEDFVLLNYRHEGNNQWRTSYSTSSSVWSKEIHRILDCEGPHNDCKRVEDSFKTVANVIRLGRE